MYNELTKNDIKKMEEEIEYRKLVVRKEAIEAVKEARAQGDLSENFEYYAAKKDKNKNESRIRYLERMIRTAKVISDDSKEDEIGLYNTVDVYFEEDDETETYKIVTTVRGNSLKNLISSESPLGKALLGHKVGDRVHVQINDKAGYDVIVKRIEKTVDDGSDALRNAPGAVSGGTGADIGLYVYGLCTQKPGTGISGADGVRGRAECHWKYGAGGENVSGRFSDLHPGRGGHPGGGITAGADVCDHGFFHQ